MPFFPLHMSCINNTTTIVWVVFGNKCHLLSVESGAHEKKCRQERATPTYLIEFRVQALSSCVAILRIPNSAHGHFTLVTRTRTPKLENTMMATPSRNLALKAILKRLQRDDKDN